MLGAKGGTVFIVCKIECKIEVNRITQEIVSIPLEILIYIFTENEYWSQIPVFNLFDF